VSPEYAVIECLLARLQRSNEPSLLDDRMGRDDGA
jgi:hypothetical protein